VIVLPGISPGGTITAREGDRAAFGADQGTWDSFSEGIMIHAINGGELRT
jgi:hypothetical protein